MRKDAKSILQELHNKFDISDEKIAVKLGVSSMSIYRWRLGKCQPSFTEVKVLQRILRGHQLNKEQ